MAAPTRQATLRWLSGPPQGSGRLRVASRAFTALRLSISEGDPNPEETTPSELMCAALCGYLGMHLAQRMQREMHQIWEGGGRWAIVLRSSTGTA